MGRATAETNAGFESASGGPLWALSRSDLLEIVERHGLEAADRRSKQGLLDAISGSGKVRFEQVLEGLSREQLKAMCAASGLEDSGREKAVLIERLVLATKGRAPSDEPEDSTGSSASYGRSKARKESSGDNDDDVRPIVLLAQDSKLTVDALERHLWSAADILRGSIDSSDYKNFIFGMLFLKRLSDVFIEEAEKLIAGGEDPTVAWSDPDEHQFFIPERARWPQIQKTATNVGEALNKACMALEEQNPSLEGVLAGIDFNDERKLGDAKNRDALLQRLIQHFSPLSLRNTDLSEPDMLGRAYEYLIEKFADDAGKKGGEFYTPNKVVALIVKLLDPKEGMRISDPTCGSGGMLIQSAKHIVKHGGRAKNFVLHGQEKNLGTWAICKMNMLLHGFPDARIEKGDTIRDPKLVLDGELMLYDRVIANPPFSLDEWGYEAALSDSYGRFRFGIPPKSKGDFAFVQHMVATLKNKGRLAVVLPHGALSRRTEEVIRAGLVHDDYVEAIVGLPSRLFHGTPEPTAIVLINRAKQHDRSKSVLFVDGSHGFASTSPRNSLRDEHIRRLTEAVENWRDEPGFARVVPSEEIERNRFDLSIAPYTSNISAEAPMGFGLHAFARRVQLEAETLRLAEAKVSEAIAALADRAPGVRVFSFDDLLRERKERRADQALPVLSVTKSSGLMLASERFGKEMHARDLSRYLVCRRDDLAVDPKLLWDGAVGVQMVVDAGVVSPDYRVFEVNREELDPLFFHALCRSPQMIAMFRSRARGTNQRRQRIPRADFLAIRVPIPERSYQEALSRLLAYLAGVGEFAARCSDLPHGVLPAPLPFEATP